MKKYIILSAGSPIILENAVNELIEDGYIPLGGISCAYYGNDSPRFSKYHQAMIKMGEQDVKGSGIS